MKPRPETLPPEVECVDCERRVRCIRVTDGTVYRPLAWSFPDPALPLNGFCADCQAKLLAEGVIAAARERSTP